MHFSWRLSPAPCRASAIFIDNVFEPAAYENIQFRSTSALGITIQHLPAESALQILYDLPIGIGDSMIGFVQPSSLYDPSTKGAVDSMSATASRYVNFLTPGWHSSGSAWQASRYVVVAVENDLHK